MVNVIVFVVEDSDIPLRVTDHDVPDGRPVSLKVIVYLLTMVLTGVNVIATGTLLPLTFTLPNDGDAEYPDTAPIEYEYVPFGRENEYEDPVIAPESMLLLRLTYHSVP
jgi:hypothetical protein